MLEPRCMVFAPGLAGVIGCTFYFQYGSTNSRVWIFSLIAFLFNPYFSALPLFFLSLIFPFFIFRLSFCLLICFLSITVIFLSSSTFLSKFFCCYLILPNFLSPLFVFLSLVSLFFSYLCSLPVCLTYVRQCTEQYTSYSEVIDMILSLVIAGPIVLPWSIPYTAPWCIFAAWRLSQWGIISTTTTTACPVTISSPPNTLPSTHTKIPNNFAITPTAATLLAPGTQAWEGPHPWSWERAEHPWHRWWSGAWHATSPAPLCSPLFQGKIHSRNCTLCHVF